MGINVAQLERQARIRYLDFRSYEKQGIGRLLGSSSPFGAHGDKLGDAVDYFLQVDPELGKFVFGDPFFRMIQRCEEFPLRIESYPKRAGRSARASALKGLEYRVIGESWGKQRFNFAHKNIPPAIPDNRLVRLMPLQRGSWRELQTSDSAIVIVPVGGSLDIAHRDRNDILPLGNAAIIMASARLLVQGKGFFAFHPTGMPV